MIDAREVLKNLKLSAPDEAEVRRLGEEIAAAVRKPEYDGRPFNIQIPVGEGEDQHARSYRIACALQRRFQANGWASQLDTTQNAFGQPEAHSLWFAIDPASMREPVAKAVAPVEARMSLRGLYDELSLIYGGADVPVLAADPVLSVLLGTYNRLPLLQAAVKSIRKSVAGLPYEIVVVDGGSTDGSRAWLAAQPDVLLVGDRHLRGAVAAFNQAFAMCRGEFVANANDDVTYEGQALAEGVKYLREHPEVGQVAFALRGDGEAWVVNEVHQGNKGTTYANHGIVRKTIADQVAYITGGFWPTCYHTYAGDCEQSAWVWRLGHKVVALPHLRVLDARPDDALREKNKARYGADTKRFYARWPAASFRPDGPEPRVTEEELVRYCEVVAEAGSPAKSPVRDNDPLETFVELVGFPEPQEERRLRKIAPLLRALDPVDGQFPKRAKKLSKERVLHVHINGKDAVDQQAGLVMALMELGGYSYEMIRWTDLDHAARQVAIADAAARLRPTIVFMQLQAPGVVNPETIKRIREVSPGVVIVLWNGDVANENRPFDVEWQVQIGRLCDIVLHSSMSHVRVLRAAGIHNSGFLNIGFDPFQYRVAGDKEEIDGVLHNIEKDFDVSFLGSRYGGGDPFSSSYKWKNGEPAHDAALRDEVVTKMSEAFGTRFGLFGSGWGPGSKVVPVTESHTVYWKSKIGLSISLDNNLEMYTSDRALRILACGAMLLVKRFPGMSVLGLVEDVNCVAFDTADAAVSLAKAYASDDVSRNRIAAEGAELASEHTWSVRMRELQPYLDVVRSVR